MPVTRSALLGTVVAPAVLALVTYVGSTALLDAWYRSQEVETSGHAQLPRLIYNAPESVPTTERRGPVGPVAAAFAGTRVLDGLLGEVDQPWIAVSSRTGGYRAVSGPQLPDAAPGGVAVSPEGDLLAWAADDALVVHHSLTGENRVLEAAGITAVGAFAPDGQQLLVHAGELRVVDVATGEQVASLGEVPARAAAQAVWRPDGTAVSLVDGRLVEIDVASGRRTPSEVAVSAAAQGLSLETGPLTRVFAVPVDGSAGVVEIGRLPLPGDNWVGDETLEVAAEALLGGTTTFEEPRWPWSHRAKLVSSIVLALFALGMHLTRRPRSRPAGLG